MKNSSMILALTLGVSALTAVAQEEGGPPPAGDRPAQREGAPGAFRGPGGPAVRPGFHLLPPRAMGILELTSDQEKEIAALEAETKAKLEKILTPEQLRELKDLRPPLGQPGMGVPPGAPRRPGAPGPVGGPGFRGPEGRGVPPGAQQMPPPQRPPQPPPPGE